MENGASWLSFCAGPAAAYGAVLLPPAALPPEPPAEAAMDPVERLTTTCLRHGRAAAEAHRLPEALAWFERALALKPELRIAQFCRAMVLADLGRAEEAATALEASLGRDADDAPARVQTARLLARHGHYDQALRVLGPALHARPSLAKRVLDERDFSALRDHPYFLQMVGALPGDSG